MRPARSALALGAVLSLTVAGCSSSSDDSPSAGATGAAKGYPVTIENCGKKVTFDKAPTRAVTNALGNFEDMVALGLAPKLVGTFGMEGLSADGKRPVPERDAAAYASTTAISPKYVTLEPLVGVKPDFLFAGWNYGLTVGSTMTPDNLAKYGIKTLAVSESCAHVQSKQAVTIENTYTDLTNLGKIFGVQPKADAVIADMKKQIADVQKKVEGKPLKKVFLYDSGKDAPFTSPGLAMPDALIALAGGTNVVHSLKQTWGTVSWEQAVATDPDCIIISEYGSPSFDEKVSFLKSSPITKNLTAVKKGCYIRLDYGQITPSPNNAAAVQSIAKALHPDAFE